LLHVRHPFFVSKKAGSPRGERYAQSAHKTMKDDGRQDFLSKITLVVAALATLALTSCIDVEQDIWFGEDGSGRAVLKFGISKQMMKMMGGLGEPAEAGAGLDDPFEIDKMRKTLAENANVISFDVSEEETEAFKYVVVDLELEDITKLEDVQAEVMSDGPTSGTGEDDGEFKITRTAEGNYKVAAKLEPPSSEDLGPAAGMIKGMLGDAGATFRIHAEPVSEDSHNGTEEDGAIVWSAPLSDLLAGKGLDIQGEFKPSSGGAGGGASTFWAVLASVLVVACVLFFIVRAQRPKLA
jgi:hypothetical protein